MDEKWDVIIVGAGPAGSSAARELKRAGIPNVLLVDKARFPRTKVCAGGLGPRSRAILIEMGLWDEISPLTYPIRGARIVTTRGKTLSLSGVESAAVIPRSDLDSFLAEKAVEAGAEFRDSTRVIGLYREGEQGKDRVRGIILEGGAVERVSDRGIVIAADGANTGFNPHRSPGCYLATAMAWFEDLPFEPNHLELIFDRKVAPHYLWVFPETENRVNVGTAVFHHHLKGRKIMDLFDQVLNESLGARLTGAAELGRRRSFPITGSRFVRIPHSPGLICIGEAARMVNLFTGEGIPFALESGRTAAGVIAASLSGPNGVSRHERVSRYRADGVPGGSNPTSNDDVGEKLERLLRRKLGPGLFAGHLLCSLGHPLLNTVGYISGLKIIKRAISSSFS